MFWFSNDRCVPMWTISLYRGGLVGFFYFFFLPLKFPKLRLLLLCNHCTYEHKKLTKSVMQ
jgi:hypothetical protein